MANPTTNYGWPMPTSTDLVTDLPADFALFGQPVDTSLKALNPETTLGDIAYRSATANTNTRLAIGSTSQVLSVVAGVPAWTTPSAGAMSVVKARTTFTNVADTGTTFDGVFTSTYRHYLIAFDNIYGATGTDDFLFQFRYAGPTTQATGYYAVNIQATTGSATVTNTAGGTGPTIQLSDNIGTSANPGYGFAYVIDAGTASAKSTILGQYHEMVTSGGGSFSGGNENSRTYTGFILKTSASNISGNVTVYGMVTA